MIGEYMAIDTRRVGNFALEAIEALAARYEDVEDVEIGGLQLIVAFKNVPQDEGPGTEILTYTEDDDVVSSLGLAVGALASMFGR